MKKAYVVELRSEEGWGRFDTRFTTAYDAINHGKLCIAEEGWVAARVWKYGPSLPGDQMIWDSRD